MKQRLCHVDPVYFMVNGLVLEANNKNSGYFDLFPENLIDDYKPLFELTNYPEYICSGDYSELLYYDVYKKDKKNYNIVINAVMDYDPYMTMQISMPYCIDNVKDGSFLGILSVVEYDVNDSTFEKYHNTEEIFFDTFNDLYGIIKNIIRQYMYKKELLK